MAKIKLSPAQRYQLVLKFQYHETGDRVFDIDFRHSVGDGSGESTQISVGNLWLHRNGTWHNQPEPAPSFVIRHTRNGYLKRRGHSDEPSLDWTGDVDKARHFTDRRSAESIVRAEVQGRPDAAERWKVEELLAEEVIPGEG